MGAWFTPPVDYDEMAERIGLNDRYEEYAIHDYELPFEIDEYTPIEEVNRLCEMVEDLTDVAYYFIDECQSLGEIPDRIRSYIDYEAYGRDLDLEGRFVVTNHGVFECPY